MDAKQLRGLRGRRKGFLEQFGDCFDRKDTRAHLATDVGGPLSNLPRKTCEPIALEAHLAPRTLQNFLSVLAWDHGRLRDRTARRVVERHAHPEAIGVLDETSAPKKGEHTPGVKRQWCGTLGKKENCVVTVHLAFAAPDFHCLLDGDLFLPEDWSADRERCRTAGIPDEVEHRPKWRIGLELLDRANTNGVKFRWLTFDEGYGRASEFLRELAQRGQAFVGEVPKSLVGWLSPSRPPPAGGGGRPSARGPGGAQRLDVLLRSSSKLRRQKWTRFIIKDTQQGPMVWEAKSCKLWVKDEAGRPGTPLRLLVARNPLTKEVKYFLASDPEARTEELLPAAFARWKVERCFEDGKGEVGLDHYEGRNWTGLLRHLAISNVSYLFLAEVRAELGKKKSGGDGLPSARGGGRSVAVLGTGPGGAAAGG